MIYRKALLFAALYLLLGIALSGCDDVSPVLALTPTPSSSPTPLPDAFNAEITAQPEATDQLGNILRGDDHYYQYLSFEDIRVYEYRDGTFLDGICVNAYPQSLDGQIDIVYYTDTGKLCGKGTLHNASGDTLLKTGTNAIYAEIETDIDVRMMDFKMEVMKNYQPVLPADTPAPTSAEHQN